MIRQHGAAAILIVQEKTPDRKTSRKTSGPTNGQIRTDRGSHALTSPFWDLPFFTITRQVADELLRPSGKTIDQLQDEIDQNGQPHSVAVPDVTVDLRRAIKDRQVIQTRNVVGVIEGSDPALKNEYVIVTGHYDHVGQSGPFIYHGADDNASATAAVIAIAEAFKANPTPPKRSLMFLDLRGGGRRPAGRVPLRRSPDRSAGQDRGGAQLRHDRARRRRPRMEHHGRSEPQRGERDRHTLQPGSAPRRSTPRTSRSASSSITRPTATIPKGGSRAAIITRLR